MATDVEQGPPGSFDKVVLSGLLWEHWRLTSLPVPQGAIFHREKMLGVLLILQERTRKASAQGPWQLTLRCPEVPVDLAFQVILGLGYS